MTAKGFGPDKPLVEGTDAEATVGRIPNALELIDGGQGNQGVGAEDAFPETTE